MSDSKTKPYVKLAGTLVGLGMAIFFVERYGLSQMQGTHLAGWIISVMVITPLLLVLAGCGIFIVGKMRRL